MKNRLNLIMMKMKKTKQKTDKIFLKRYAQALTKLPEITVKKYEEWLKEQVSERFIKIFEEELK